ncbi:MAG TPA: double-strand break repair protein AddB, partial [Rhabdaerophilum sp.]|nr:double-strand break repair protein AddB [Rhabdaerophilum sp.]
GAAPNKRDILAHRAAQLPVTAALARRGAFPDVPAEAKTVSLAHLSVGGQEPVEPVAVEPPDMSLDAFAEEDWRLLEDQLLRLARGEEAYRARLAPKSGNRPGEYDHLARVDEWQMPAAGEDAE